MTRNTVTKEVVDIVNYETDESVPLIKVIAVLQDALSSIPEEHRETAILHVTASGDDYAAATVRVEYTRPETDDEIAAREARNAQYLAQRAADERSTYERLKRKFEQD